MFAFIGGCKTYLVNLYMSNDTWWTSTFSTLPCLGWSFYFYIFCIAVCLYSAYCLPLRSCFCPSKLFWVLILLLFCCFFFGFCFCVCFFLLLLLLFLPFVAFVCPFFCGCVAWICFFCFCFAFFFAFFSLFFSLFFFAFF